MPKSFCFFFKKNKNMMHTNNHPHSSGQSPGLEQPRPPCVLPAFHPCMLLVVFVNHQTSSYPCFCDVLNLFELIANIYGHSTRHDEPDIGYCCIVEGNQMHHR